MQHATQVALTRRVIDFVERGTTELAESVYLNPVSTYACPRQAEREQHVLFRGHPLFFGLILRVAQSRRLPRRRFERRADPGGARQGRRAQGLPQCLPASRRQDRQRLGLRQTPVRVPLSRLDLRSRRPADAAQSRGRFSRPHLRRAQPGAAPGRGETWPDLRAGNTRRTPSTSMRCWARTSPPSSPHTASTPTATTRRKRSPRT